jgi:hypothetical protein
MREMLYTDSQDMLVLGSIVASRYCKCCSDGSTSPGNYGYPFISIRIRFFLTAYDEVRGEYCGSVNEDIFKDNCKHTHTHTHIYIYIYIYIYILIIGLYILLRVYQSIYIYIYIFF